jgi:hypothetical protein
MFHTEGITLNVGEKIYEVAGRTNWMGLDGISEIRTRLVMEKLLECMFLQQYPGSGRSLGRSRGQRNEVGELVNIL